MVFGELVSFAVLSSGKDTFLERVAVVLALVFGCLLLLMQFFVVLHDDVVRQTDPVMSISLWLAASLVVLIVVLAGGALIVLQGE